MPVCAISSPPRDSEKGGGRGWLQKGEAGQAGDSNLYAIAHLPANHLE